MRTTPSPTVRTLVGASVDDDVLAPFEGDETPAFAPYGYTKTALRDAIRLLDTPPTANVVLPSYLPDGAIEPFREAGLDPRYYRIEPDLGPDLGHVEERIDGGTAALVAADYFGFPAPRLDELRALCDDHGIALVEDNAHSPLSRHEGDRLGTTGDVGVTSFHKLFAVPNGAGLLLVDDHLAGRMDRLELDGIEDSFTRRDAAFAGAGLGNSLADGPGALSRIPAVLDRVRTGGDASGARDPEAIYHGSKTPMSRLAAHVLRRTPRRRCVGRRRQNYRFWLRTIDGLEGVEPVYDSLPDGTCPQAFPAVVEDADALALHLDEWDLFSTWPPLPHDVGTAFETATRLADELVRLPVHHRLTEVDLRPLATALRRRRG